MRRVATVAVLTVSALLAQLSIARSCIPMGETRDLGVVAFVIVVGIPCFLPCLLVAGVVTVAVRRELIAAGLWLSCLIVCSVVSAFELILEGGGGGTWRYDEPFRAYVLDRWWLLVAWAVALAVLPRAFRMVGDESMVNREEPH